jgi:hypothetical protein
MHRRMIGYCENCREELYSAYKIVTCSCGMKYYYDRTTNIKSALYNISDPKFKLEESYEKKLREEFKKNRQKNKLKPRGRTKVVT